MTPQHKSPSAQLAWLARAYLKADYRWARGSDWHDVRIGLPAPALELFYAQCGTFGMLSAWNPSSIARDEVVNRRADHELHDALVAHGTPFCAAFASAPNRSWREPSWVAMDYAHDDFIALSRRFGQLGTLWWTRGQPVRLRLDAARPDGFDGDAHIDWLK